ncbi:hypothetical protein Tco_1348392, partial [Tanacetum coccineum]
MAKPISNKAQEQNPAEPRDKSNLKIEFSKELLTELQNNTFSGRSEEDGAKEWWMNEGNGNIFPWEELVKKFFKKFYPLSCASNYDKMCDDDEEGRDPLEFIPWIKNDDEWEKQEYGNPPKDLFPKPYFEMDKNDHNENNGDTYKSSGMDLSGAPQSEKINHEQPNVG